MPRRPRLVIPGVAHHITQRGNDRQTVFRSAVDRRTYLDLLRHYATRHGVHLIGYCLMTNHVHLVAVPDRADALARTLRRVHSEYAAKWNRAHDRTGHLWRNRFFSCPLDQSHMLTALRYVEQNPVRAGLVKQPLDWPWSSARAHCVDGFIDWALDRDWIDYVDCWNSFEWKAYLTDPENQPVGGNTLRRATLTGQPFGSQEFIGDLEREAGHYLRVLARGRPRKASAVIVKCA